MDYMLLCIFILYVFVTIIIFKTVNNKHKARVKFLTKYYEDQLSKRGFK